MQSDCEKSKIIPIEPMLISPHPDCVTYLEMARIAMACVPDEIEGQMDLSDEEFIRLRDQLNEFFDCRSRLAELLSQEGF